MPVHERAKVLLFVPYATSARLCGTAYVNDLAHTDTEYLIADLEGATQDSGLIGSGLTNFNVTALTLNIAETYTARIRYVNASGSAVWSATVAATVFSGGFDLPALAGPALPGETTAPIPLPLAPSFAVEVENRRGLVTHISQAGHHIRRLTSAEGTRRIRLQWFGLTLAQRDTVLAVLQDSLGSYDTSEVRGFDFSTVQPSAPRPVAGVSFLPIRGTIVHRELTSNVYEVTIDATEIRP